MENNRFQWKKVCIVGLGGHAKNRLIPAIENSINQYKFCNDKC